MDDYFPPFERFPFVSSWLRIEPAKDLVSFGFGLYPFNTLAANEDVVSDDCFLIEGFPFGAGDFLPPPDFLIAISCSFIFKLIVF